MSIKRFLRWAAALLAVCLMLPCLSGTALAYTSMDTSREASLKLHFGSESTGFPGVEFRIYRVADVSSDMKFTLAGDFAQYPVSLENLDSSGWRSLAQTLEAYVSRDRLTPLQQDFTNDAGDVTFDQLSTGLYLAVGYKYRQGRYTYTPESFLICLPGLDQQTGEWVYDAYAVVKYDTYHRPGGDGDDDDDDPGDNDVSRKVIKVWEDQGNEGKRPQSITVQLLGDGSIYDTVTLNQDNNWRYTWDGLDPQIQWQIAEVSAPEGYTVSVNRQGITFVLTNTYKPGGPGDSDDPPGDPDNPGNPGNPGEPGNPGDLVDLPPGDTPLASWTEGGPIDSSVLPQTGVLWWPVPVLAGSGMILFLAGWIRNRSTSRRRRHGK